MKNAKTEEDKARMKDRWLQIDAEQNEEWLRKQGTGTYIDLSTIKKGDMPGQVILEKHNRYKEALNKAALDKSKEIAAEEIASWSAAKRNTCGEHGRKCKYSKSTGTETVKNTGNIPDMAGRAEELQRRKLVEGAGDKYNYSVIK